MQGSRTVTDSEKSTVSEVEGWAFPSASHQPGHLPVQ